MASLKIDEGRLRHIERIASRELSASATAHEAMNAIATERHELRLDLQRLEAIASRSGADADTRAKIGAMTVRIGELNEDYAAAAHNHEAAQERASAAGNLARSCESFLTSSGKVRA